jgi:hypothetical protein
MDLSLVPIDELIKEIDKRTDANVVLTIKSNHDKDFYNFHHFGGHMTVLGMVEQFAFSLKDKKEMEESGGFYED